MPNVYTDNANNLATTQVTVDTSGTVQLVAARTNRRSVQFTIADAGTNDLYYGSANPVVIGAAAILPGIKGASASTSYNGAIYGSVSSGTKTVTVEEEF